MFPFSTAKEHLAGLSDEDISSSCISSVSAFLLRLSSPASLMTSENRSVFNERRVSSPQLISESVSLSVLSSEQGAVLSESVPSNPSRMSLEFVWLASSLFDLTSFPANLFSSCWGTSSLLYFLLLCSLFTNLSTVEPVSCNIWLSSASSGEQLNDWNKYSEVFTTAATDRSWLGKAMHLSTFFSSSSFSTLCEIWDMLSSVNISSSTSSRKRSKSSINSSSIEFSMSKENFAMSSETFFRFLHTFVLCCCRTESPLSSIEERLPFLSSNETSEYLTRTSASFR